MNRNELWLSVCTLIMAGVFTVSCSDDSPSAPDFSDVTIELLQPEDQALFLAGDPVPCEVRVEGLQEYQVNWKVDNHPADCSEGVFSPIPAAGVRTISVDVRSQGVELYYPGGNQAVIRMLPPITGTVYPLDENGEIMSSEGMYASIEHNGKVDQFEIENNGKFQIKSELVDASFFEVCIRPKDEHYASCLNASRNNINEIDLNFILIPKQWQVKSQVYNGIIDIDLHMAFDRNAGSTHENSRSFYKQNKLVSIPIQDRPLKVFFSGDESIKDSTHFWEEIEQLERYLGIGKVFTSSQVEGEGQVEVIYSADGPVNAEPFQYGNTITGGIIRLRHKDRMLDTAVMHEAVHIMGFGHTCSWPTIGITTKK